MLKIVANLLKFIACYLVAGVAYLLYFHWPDYAGHAHIPFSGFPSFLIFCPAALSILFEELATNPWQATPSALVFVITLAASLWLAFRKRPRRTKPSVSGFAWALLFLSGGRMPPPPPQSQIEQEAGERKNRGITNGED